ncbi:MAG TPA: 30S ribosomal protein S4 [Candidatus Paceibacterota bacterium]
MRIGSKYKICRRLGSGVFSKCQTNKYAISEGKKKLNIKQGRKHRSTRTEFGAQLLEKQKIRLSYGLNERQLLNYVVKSRNKKGTMANNEIFRTLESRLDNVIYRMGLVPTRAFARQAITHGHICVNGKKVTRPSYEIKLNDIIGIRQTSMDNGIFKDRKELLKEFTPPSWISLDKETLSARVIATPKSGEQSHDLNFTSILQFYSRV